MIVVLEAQRKHTDSFLTHRHTHPSRHTQITLSPIKNNINILFVPTVQDNKKLIQGQLETGKQYQSRSGLHARACVHARHSLVQRGIKRLA